MFVSQKFTHSPPSILLSAAEHGNAGLGDQLRDYARSLWAADATKTLVEVRARLAGSTLAPPAWIRGRTTLTDCVVGSDVFVGFRSDIRHAVIGTSCQIASRVTIAGTADRPVRLGPGAWIGAGADMDAGVTIGAGAVVAAGAHVSTEVPPGVIVAGRPARAVRHRKAIDDGLPRFGALLHALITRQRSPLATAQSLLCLLDPFLSELDSALHHMLVEANPVVAAWCITKPDLVDAELDGGRDVEIGERAVLMGRGARLGGPFQGGGITIGDRTRIGPDALLEGAGGIRIGVGAVVGAGVTVVSTAHDHSRTSLPMTACPVVIGDGCRIGDDALIVGPMTLGAHSEVAPGAVVIRDVAPGTTTHGIVRRR